MNEDDELEEVEGTAIEPPGKREVRPIRIYLPLDIYKEVKAHCPEHGDMTRLVRHLLSEWLKKPHELGEIGRLGL